MNGSFHQRLCALIAGTPPSAGGKLAHVRPAIEDTLAVTLAGWGEEVTRLTAQAYGLPQEFPLPVPDAAAMELAALVYGVAGHALDFDDVHMGSTTHPSVPIVAALAAAAQLHPELAHRTASAYAVGLACNVGLGEVLGFPHYEKGWHATSTIGPLATAAALAHLFGLDAQRAAHALALAAAQAGGLQRNFGHMAKPVQAGMAAQTGLRAAVLARAGVTADPDIFGPKGYFDLYGGKRLVADADAVPISLDQAGICVKLYPCCYMSHRPAGAGLEARRVLQQRGIAPAALHAVEVRGVPGVFTALRVSDPRIGSEAKFCGPYVVACALLDGQVSLSHFQDDAVRRPDVRALMQRIRLVELPARGDASAHGGAIELVGRDAAGAELVRTEQAAFPGSPESPPTPAERKTKVRDCLAHYRRGTGQAFSPERLEQFIATLLGERSAPAQPELFRAAGD